MNSIAEYYEIYEIKSMANKTIYDLCEHCWSPDGAAAAVKFTLAYTSNPEVYSILSTALADILTNSMLESMNWENFLHKKVVNHVSLGVIQELSKRMKASERRLELAEEDVNDLRLAGERALESLSELEEEIQKMTKVIETHESTRRCQRCDKFWEGGYIEIKWPYTVRCLECRSRQYMKV